MLDVQQNGRFQSSDSARSQIWKRKAKRMGGCLFLPLLCVLTYMNFSLCYCLSAVKWTTGHEQIVTHWAPSTTSLSPLLHWSKTPWLTETQNEYKSWTFCSFLCMHCLYLLLYSSLSSSFPCFCVWFESLYNQLLTWCLVLVLRHFAFYCSNFCFHCFFMPLVWCHFSTSLQSFCTSSSICSTDLFLK